MLHKLTNVLYVWRKQYCHIKHENVANININIVIYAIYRRKDWLNRFSVLTLLNTTYAAFACDKLEPSVILQKRLSLELGSQLFHFKHKGGTYQ